MLRTALVLGLALGPCIATLDAAAESIDVMTQNQYLGADLAPLTIAPDLPSFLAAAETALLQIAANNFPERAQGLAESIVDRLPEVVALQEVFNFRFDLDGPGGPLPPMNGPPPFVDHLQATLDALAALGETYVPVAGVQNLSIEIDGVSVPGLGVVTVGVTDRDVILVRGDLAAQAFPIPFASGCVRPSADGSNGCNYQAVVPIPVPFPPFAINSERGFTGIDILVGGKWHRVVNTHLEIREPDGTLSTRVFQALQAFELIQTLAVTPNPTGANVIVLGDINSAPADATLANPGPFNIPPFDAVIVPPYRQLADAGYTDAWVLRPGAATGQGDVLGLSCCQTDDLSNLQSQHDERIDVIFSAEVPEKVKKARVLGSRVSDKTAPSDLWPSDHGSVAADLRF